MVWSGSLANFSSWTASWTPFRLDALGLVTLLGADEVARNTGSLTRNTYTDFLPAFGAYKVAANQFATQEAGFTLYNLTDGIAVAELNGWITRWLSSNLDAKFTILKMSVRQKARGHCRRVYVAFSIGLFLGLGLLLLALVQGDWYGLANAIAMIIATSVRNYLLGKIRGFLDTRTTEVLPSRDTKQTRMGDATLRRLSGAAGLDTDAGDRSLRPDTPPVGSPEGIVKLLIVLPDGRVAISLTQRGMIPIILVDLDEPAATWSYRIARAIGWIAFAIHIIAIGQAYLLTQIVTVTIMSTATICTIMRLGVHREHQIASFINIQQLEVGHYSPGSKISQLSYSEWKKKQAHDEEKGSESHAKGKSRLIEKAAGSSSLEKKKLNRKDIYVRLDPSNSERGYLHNWSLFPQKGNPSTDEWLNDFNKRLHDWKENEQFSDQAEYQLEREFLGQKAYFRDDSHS